MGIVVENRRLYRAVYFTAAETARTNVDMPWRPVNDRRNALNIRFPHTVAASVGVTDLNTE